MVYGTQGAQPLAAPVAVVGKRLAAAPRFGKANFNPAQLRITAGEPEGGEWTSEGGVAPRSADVEAGPEKPFQLAQAQTCRDFIAENCNASILRVFPGQFLDVPVDEIYRAADEGDAAARRAKKLLSRERYRK